MGKFLRAHTLEELQELRRRHTTLAAAARGVLALAPARFAKVRVIQALLSAAWKARMARRASKTPMASE